MNIAQISNFSEHKLFHNSYSFRSIANQNGVDIQTVHHILKNTAVQNVNKLFVYITDLTSTLIYEYNFASPRVTRGGGG